MSQSDALAAPAGKAPPTIEKMSGDARVYRVDCTPLLRPHELLTRVMAAKVHAGDVALAGARTRDGRYLELTLAGGGTTSGRTVTESIVGAVMRTTQGQVETRAVVRVHA